VFRVAAAKWGGVITAGLATFTNPPPGNSPCGVPWPSVVDDLFICARYSTLDGNIIGFAGPIFPNRAESESGLPALGQMEFDRAKIALFGSNFEATIVCVYAPCAFPRQNKTYLRYT